MIKEITLPNRYDGNNVQLVQIEDNGDEYVLKHNAYYISEHYKVEDGSKEIMAIDPEGGPYLYVGMELVDGLYINSITYKDNVGYVFKLFPKGKQLLK